MKFYFKLFTIKVENLIFKLSSHGIALHKYFPLQREFQVPAKIKWNLRSLSPLFKYLASSQLKSPFFPFYSFSGISCVQSDAIIFKEIRNGRRTSLVEELFGLRGLQILVVEGTLDELALGPCSGTSIFKFRSTFAKQNQDVFIIRIFQSIFIVFGHYLFILSEKPKTIQNIGRC